MRESEAAALKIQESGSSSMRPDAGGGRIDLQQFFRHLQQAGRVRGADCNSGAGVMRYIPISRYHTQDPGIRPGCVDLLSKRTRKPRRQRVAENNQLAVAVPLNVQGVPSLTAHSLHTKTTQERSAAELQHLILADD